MKRLGSKGISLVELLVASALSALISIMGYQVLITMVKGQNRSANSMTIRIVGQAALDEVKRRVGNAIFLDPAEGLETADDSAYLGVGGVRNTDHSPGCVYEANGQDSEKFSILRFTSFEYKQSPEPTKRLWNDYSGFAEPLRVGFHPDGHRPPHAFQDGQIPPEIYIIDSDFLSMQRFRLHGVEDIPLTHLDPYDDQDRSPTEFSYRKLTLLRPKSLNGATHETFNKTFATGSFVYGVRTWHLCKSTDGKLILKEEGPSGETKVLLDPGPNNATLDRFEVRYYGTRKNPGQINLLLHIGGDKMSFFDFFIFPWEDPAKRLCINNISIEMDFGSMPPSSTKVERFRDLITLHAFNTRRPAACK